MHRMSLNFGILKKGCNEEVKNPERLRDVLYARRREQSPHSSIAWSFREFAEHMLSFCRVLEARRQGGRTLHCMG